ncbi:MAG: hypothetical protein COX62_04065, partial [Deltaproteobacteria bacterium CG_4_10_14_0_2_um_filter_43_8]
FSLLVVPFYHQQYKLSDFPDFVTSLQELEASGAEIILHGFHHLELTPNTKAFHRFATGGEGEFAELDQKATKHLLQEGLEELHRCKLSPKGFIPPAWLDNPHLLNELSQLDLHFSETHFYLHETKTKQKTFSPVMTYIHRKPIRRELAILYNAFLKHTFPFFSFPRIALHPPDVRNKRIWNQMKSTLRFLNQKVDFISNSDLIHFHD